MSDAGDEIAVEAPTVEVAAEAVPKGKLSVEDALQVWCFSFLSNTHTNQVNLSLILCFDL